MGGIVILISFTAVSLIFMRSNPDAAAVLLLTLGFGAIGFLDDYIKVVKKRSLGLRVVPKLLLQAMAVGGFIAYLYLSGGFAVSGVTGVYIPFSNGKILELGYAYIPFIVLVILGSVNGSNLTDGLDGLNAGVTAFIAMFFLLAAGTAAGKISPLAGAFIGSLLGFLLYNSYPAKVIMGDTGSLALGGFVAGYAIITKMPLFIAIVAIIYLIEDVSVMIQVGYYKLTKKRFFKMAPIHHAFELSDWQETKIIALFYIVTIVFCFLGFLGAANI